MTRVVRAKSVAVAGAVGLACFVGCGDEDGATGEVRLVLWHSQRGAEGETLEELLRSFNAAHRGAIVVEPLLVPDQSFKDKVIRNVARGSGPDVFIRPHNELGELVLRQTVRPLVSPWQTDLVSGLPQALTFDDERYGAALTYKGLVLFYRPERFPNGPPAAFEGLVSGDRDTSRYPLVYDATNLYFHAPFALASGANFLEGERVTLFEDRFASVFELPGELRGRGLLPSELSYNEAIRLFEEDGADAVMTGPWYTPKLAEGAWRVSPLPSYNGRPMGSLVTVETAYLSASGRHPEAATELLKYLTSEEAQLDRMRALGVPPCDQRLSEVGREGSLVEAVEQSLAHGLVTPNSPKMASVWGPANDLLRTSLSGRPVAEERARAKRAMEALSAAPTTANPTLGGVGLVALLLGLSTWLGLAIRRDLRAPTVASARLAGRWGSASVPYVVPGLLAMTLVVLIPTAVAALMSLFEWDGSTFRYVGLDNFATILAPRMEEAFEARSFYYALVVTVAWTALNVLLHVVIGVALALLFRPAWVRYKTPIKLLLILPWAIPNYITALIWKGMFHAQIGAINRILVGLGGGPISWFESFHTAFAANLITNTWLGFPFMMVVTLSALTAMPKDLEEAATLDGAGRIDRLRYLYWPSIRPALVPAMVLGSVWTFNMFNVVYLVSGGEPASQTDILVSEAYRWAFERGERYGFAAAYSVLIFTVLLAYSGLTDRLTGRGAQS